MPNNQNNEQIDYSQPYISNEEFLRCKGVDLNVELQNNDRHTDKVNRFIRDLTDFVMGWLMKNYGCNELNLLEHEFSELPHFRRVRFHFGMIEQVEYVLNNGLIHQDSGINPDTGAITDYSNVVISKSAFDQFFFGGFCNIERE